MNAHKIAPIGQVNHADPANVTGPSNTASPHNTRLTHKIRSAGLSSPLPRALPGFLPTTISNIKGSDTLKSNSLTLKRWEHVKNVPITRARQKTDSTSLDKSTSKNLSNNRPLTEREEKQKAALCDGLGLPRTATKQEIRAALEEAEQREKNCELLKLPYSASDEDIRAAWKTRFTQESAPLAITTSSSKKPASLFPKIAQCADLIKKMGAWDSTAGELAVAWVQSHPDEFTGAHPVHIWKNGRPYSLPAEGKGAGSPIRLIYDGTHYQASETNTQGKHIPWGETKANGDCFFRAIIAMARGMRPETISDQEIQIKRIQVAQSINMHAQEANKLIELIQAST